jgi:2-oxoglutarate dehydrogenase E2 component (dihydrolipoamide succinyltransferase)
MSQVEVTIPSVGESISEATIARWHSEKGAWVEKDDVIFEIETDKASVEVSAPASGSLEILAGDGDTVAIGAVVGRIDTSAERPAQVTTSKPATPASPTNITTKSTPVVPPAASRSVSEEALKGLGPSARKAVREGKRPAPNASSSTWVDPSLGMDTERKKMTPIRKKIAERLMQSQHGTATLTTFNEVDMSQILNVRKQLKDQFQEKFDVKLGFMSFFTKAVCYAAEEVTSVNAFIEGDDVVYHKNVSTSIAVSTDRGLVVPVLRNANLLSYAGIEKGIGDLAERARIGKLGIEEMMGGTFTITNGGVFGSLLSTPILNPPQSAILGMHKTEFRPVAIADEDGNYEVVARPMMYVALSYDHRLIDGKDSVTFLVKVKEYLEQVTPEQVMT